MDEAARELDSAEAGAASNVARIPASTVALILGVSVGNAAATAASVTVEGRPGCERRTTETERLLESADPRLVMAQRPQTRE